MSEAPSPIEEQWDDETPEVVEGQAIDTEDGEEDDEFIVHAPPPDPNDQIDEAEEVQTEDFITGNLDTKGDVDMFKFTVVDGKVIVEKGHSTQVDEQAVYERARAAARRLLKRMNWPIEPRWPHVG